MPVLIRSAQRAMTIAQAQGDGRPRTASGVLLTLGGRQTKAGQWVDRDRALTVGALYAGVAYIADIVAVLPLHVYRRVANGNREQLRSPNEQYIWGRPNPEVNRFTFWQTVLMQLTLHGNAYLYVNDVGARRTLWPVDPERVAVKRGPDGKKFFLIDQKEVERPLLDNGSMVHLIGPSIDGLQGLSIVQLMAQTLGLSLGAEEYAARFYSNQSAPGGYFGTEQALNAAQAKEFLDGWEATHQGPANAHKVALVTRGMKWMTTTLKPEDLQLIDARKFQVSDVARFLRMPEFLLGSHDKESSWGSGIFEIIRGMFTFRVDPLLANLEQSISDEFLGALPNGYVKFERKAFMRMDPKSQAEYLQIKKRNGVLSANEWRELDDDEPLAGQMGNQYTVEQNMALLNEDGTATPISGGASGETAAAPAMTESEKWNALGSNIRSGFEPDASLEALGLPAVDHTGLLPVTLQSQAAAEAAPAPAAAAPRATRTRRVVERDEVGRIVAVIEEVAG